MCQATSGNPRCVVGQTDSSSSALPVERAAGPADIEARGESTKGKHSADGRQDVTQDDALHLRDLPYDKVGTDARRETGRVTDQKTDDCVAGQVGRKAARAM